MTLWGLWGTLGLGLGLRMAFGLGVGTGPAIPIATTAEPAGSEAANIAPDGWSTCQVAGRSDYYLIELVPTRNVSGTAYVDGRANVTFRSSPFGVSIAADGSYVQDVHVEIDRLRPAPAGRQWVAWVTTTEIDQIERLGPLDGAGRVSGPVSWNKFLVVVTLEPTDEQPRAATSEFAWQGPVAFRGMSRSGKMHTMVGHGPLQDENCAAYGFSR